MTDVLYPKATAVWLIDNTGLTFEQIAAFCGLHPLEVRGIADGDVAAGVIGADPIANDQLTREEIAAGEADADYRLVQKVAKHDAMLNRKRKGPRYTPLSRRQERPNAIAWLVKNHPELSDGQISKLIGTTKTTIQAVRDRTHWNASNIQAQDPVALGLCAQIDLDDAVRKAASRRAEHEPPPAPEGPTLAPADPDPALEERPADTGPVDADSVFASLGGAARTAPEED